MTSPNLAKLPVDEIEIAEGRRQIDAKSVAVLKESLSVIGLQSPIIVTRSVSGDGVHVHTLVAGRHRLEAARGLGWSHIDCIVKQANQFSAVDAEMWEIAENLHRADLTKEERDRQIRRYAELIEVKKSLVVQNEPPTGLRKDGRSKGPQHEKGTAAKIADQTGLSKSTVQRVLNHEAEQARKEAEKRNRDTNRTIALSAADDFAGWLMARTDLHELPTVISWLEGTKPKDVIAALRRVAA